MWTSSSKVIWLLISVWGVARTLQSSFYLKSARCMLCAVPGRSFKVYFIIVWACVDSLGTCDLICRFESTALWLEQVNWDFGRNFGLFLFFSSNYFYFWILYRCVNTLIGSGICEILIVGYSSLAFFWICSTFLTTILFYRPTFCSKSFVESLSWSSFFASWYILCSDGFLNQVNSSWASSINSCVTPFTMSFALNPLILTFGLYSYLCNDSRETSFEPADILKLNTVPWYGW